MSNLVSTLNALKNEFNDANGRSAWDRGVNLYAVELVAELTEAVQYGYVTADDLCNSKLVKKQLLNGADDWTQYSDGGCSLISDSDIAERLCTASELKRNKNGEREPNSRESWLDTQARALRQAALKVNRRVLDIVNNL